MPFPAMGETLDFMQKMWGMSGMPTPGNLASMAARLPQQMPSMIAPTVDIEELDKRIADLRAVEQWLELNASMLRTTIQTLEVQRATIATLKGISGAMLAPLTKSGQKPEASPLAMPAFPLPPPEQEAEPAAPHARKSSQRRHKAKPAHAPTVSEAPLNPTAWWNTLQDQFTKIAASAAAGAAAGAAQAPAKKSPKSAGPRRARKAGKGA
jgi:hypothetical protein